jgi:anaerobic ribonucleoside-triphosphate reductase activating protein
MRYAEILPFEVCNGEGIGCSLFTQGCYFQCKGCFNKDAWDINGGKEWTDEVDDKFFEILDKSYIKRVSILGGEPLIEENLGWLYEFIKCIKKLYPDKKIWLYTGYTFDELMSEHIYRNDERGLILKYCDVLVEGRFIESQKDVTLKFRGSSNQNIWKKEDGIWVKTT